MDIVEIRGIFLSIGENGLKYRQMCNSGGPLHYYSGLQNRKRGRDFSNSYFLYY